MASIPRGGPDGGSACCPCVTAGSKRTVGFGLRPFVTAKTSATTGKVSDSRDCRGGVRSATRIHFSTWLQVLPGRPGRIAKTLAGERRPPPSLGASVSAGRISQIRGDLRRSQQAFAGEMMPMA